MRQRSTFCPHIGEVYAMYFDGAGSTQRGWRPGVVFQNDIGNRLSPNIMALPLTSLLKKISQPTRISICAVSAGQARDVKTLPGTAGNTKGVIQYENILSEKQTPCWRQ